MFKIFKTHHLNHNQTSTVANIWAQTAARNHWSFVNRRLASAYLFKIVNSFKIGLLGFLNKMTPQLSEGALATICQGGEYNKPVLQVSYCCRIKLRSHYYCSVYYIRGFPSIGFTRPESTVLVIIPIKFDA